MQVDGKVLKLTRLSDVESQTIEWLWGGYIPRGMITLIDGDPGLGKSTLTTYIGSCVSKGEPLEGDTESFTPKKVIVASTEDHIACVIKPRYEAAGANMDNILFLECVYTHDDPEIPFMLPEHFKEFKNACELHEPALVIIDPLMSVLSPSINSYSDQEVRKAMGPLKNIAEKYDTSVICVRHLNKGTDKPAMYKGGGSIGIIGAARSGLLVSKHPKDSNLRVLSGIKFNVGPRPSSIAFELVNDSSASAPSIKWHGKCDYSADDLVQDPKPQSKLIEAEEFLKSRLLDGPVLQSVIKSESDSLRITEATLNRAKQSLGIKPHKTDSGGAWEWQLPQDVQGDQEPPIQ